MGSRLTPKHLHINNSQEQGEVYPGTGIYGAVIRQWMEDEDGNRLTNEDVYDLFANNEAIGVYVKKRYDALFDGDAQRFPLGGRITDIDEENVLVDNQPIPKASFHLLYELD